MTSCFSPLERCCCFFFRLFVQLQNLNFIKHRNSQQVRGPGPRCHGCEKCGHIRRFCKEVDNRQTKDTKLVKRKSNAAKDYIDSDRESLGFITPALTAGESDNGGETWIVDSGATCHI